MRRAAAGISSPPDFLHINEAASILLYRSLVTDVSCGDDLQGVKYENARTLSARVESKVAG